ncbi:MAG TPA: glycosyltransferase family 1 protein [Catalimonadaceae bacterium]|nr:glycosyltransferase family 1 protein [Catalimonadaceae bacterium]
MTIGYDAKRAFHNQTGLGNYSRTLIAGMMKQYPGEAFRLFDVGQPMELPYFIRQLNDSQADWKMETGGWLGKNSRTYGWGSKARSLGLDIYHGLSNEIPLDWKSGKTKAVVTIHDVIFKRFPSSYKPLDRWIYNFKTSFATKKADLILATSQQTKADLERWYPDSLGKIEVVYQDADPGFHYRKRPEAVARILYRHDLVERPYILCVSKLERRKNHKILLEAFKKAMPYIPEDLVLIGGRGDTAEEILNQLGDFEGRLRWLGRVEADDLVNLYDGASFCVFPSVFEGFGIPLLEAMRRGKAQATSTGSCFEEIAGTAALYSPPDNSEALAQSIVNISTKPQIKLALEAACRQEVKRFDPNLQLNRIHQLYQQILK